MIIDILFALVVVIYFSAILAFTYDVDEKCDCKSEWYFDYIKYFSMSAIILRVIFVLYTIVIIMSYNTTFIWENNAVKYVILLLFTLNIAGNAVYIYSLFKYLGIVDDDSTSCECHRNKFFDIIRIASYIYIGILCIKTINFIVKILVSKH